VNNIANIKNLYCVESNSKLFEEYNAPNNIIKPFNYDVYEFLKLCCSDKLFDIINLDFCTYFCDEDMITRNSSGKTVRNVLSSRRFKPNSIIFTTFLLNGIHVKLSKYKESILTTPEDIVSKVVEIGLEHNIKLRPLDEIFLYKPSSRGWNTMMHTGFIVDAM
jgi:hypothetical protein